MMMTAMIIGVVGISVAASIPAAEAGSISTTRSNIKSGNIVQQDGDVSCTNQAQGQGGQQAVANTDPTAITKRPDQYLVNGLTQYQVLMSNWGAILVDLERVQEYLVRATQLLMQSNQMIAL